MDENNKKQEVLGSESEQRARDMETIKKLSPYERTRRAVYATGNKWARENFETTHN